MHALLHRHPELGRDAARALIFRVDDRDELVKPDDVERVVARGDRALGGETAAPGATGEPPPDLDPGGELREERRVRESDEAEQRADVLRRERLGRPEAEPVRVPVGDGTRLKRGAWPPDRPAG